MQIKIIIHCLAAVLWSFSAAYLVYIYYLNAGHWKNPLYVSLFLYFIVIISRLGFNKVNLFIFIFYIGFAIWFTADLFLALTGTFR